jgi:hypothetical protein
MNPRDSGADRDNVGEREHETQQGEQGLSLDVVLAEFTQYFQQDINHYLYRREDLHTFQAEIIPEHNSLWVVVTSTLSPLPGRDRPPHSWRGIPLMS